jgi:diaminopimelate epimerase
MTLSIEEIGLIVALSTACTTGTTTAVIYAFKEQVKSDLCEQMEEKFQAWEKKFEDLFIRVGILEKQN